MLPPLAAATAAQGMRTAGVAVVLPGRRRSASPGRSGGLPSLDLAALTPASPAVICRSGAPSRGPWRKRGPWLASGEPVVIEEAAGHARPRVSRPDDGRGRVAVVCGHRAAWYGSGEANYERVHAVALVTVSSAQADESWPARADGYRRRPPASGAGSCDPNRSCSARRPDGSRPELRRLIGRNPKRWADARLRRKPLLPAYRKAWPNRPKGASITVVRGQGPYHAFVVTDPALFPWPGS